MKEIIRRTGIQTALFQHRSIEWVPRKLPTHQYHPVNIEGEVDLLTIFWAAKLAVLEAAVHTLFPPSLLCHLRLVCRRFAQGMI